MSVTQQALLLGGGGGVVSGSMDGLTATGAWSMSRNLYTAFGGSKYTTTSGAVDTFSDQSGNGRNFTQSTALNRPLPGTAGPYSRACLVFDGVSRSMATAAVLSSFIAASAGYMIVSIYIDAFLHDNPNGYLNSAIIFDTGQYAGLTVRIGNILYANNYQGGPSQAQGTVILSTPYVVEWRHEGGILYQRVNGAGETSIASNNTQLLTFPLALGISTLSYPFAGKIFEAATFAIVPLLAVRNALVQDFRTNIGA